MTICAIAVNIADIHRDPDPTSELVTQALLNMPAHTSHTSGAWTRVTLSDYAGWAYTSDLGTQPMVNIDAERAAPLDQVAVLNVTYAPLFADAAGHETLGSIYLSTVLPLLDTTQVGRLHVALAGKRMAWIAREHANICPREAPYPHTPIDTVTSYARAFLNVPYLWGGTSWEGIDCSAFVQLCYRMGGPLLPRDADQQHDILPHHIKREEMQEGDLLFFGRETLTHVGMALNNQEYIHADGQDTHRVSINSLDTAAPHYNQQRDETFWAIKRVVES